MRPNNIEDIYPLSPMQQGILFHTLVAGEPQTYVVQVAWTLRGDLDVEAWKRAWQETFDRHAMLRTAFAWEKLAEPVQIVWKKLKPAFEEQDLRGLPAADRGAAAARFADKERKKGFDPTRAPLMRFGLLRLDDGAWRFVWTMHHLLLDGWSTQIVVKEVFGLYAALSKGQTPKVERARPFGEYIGWIQKQDPAKAEAFWRNKLAGFSAPTPFGVDRPAVGEPRFGERRLMLPEATATAISAFARQHQLTVNTLLQGAWSILLARYSREEDVVFGSTVSGRSAPIPGVESMVGLFINTIPVRVRVPADRTVRDFLADLQREEADAREHEHSPLAQVQGFSSVPRGTPLFESLVVFENFPVAEAGARGSQGGALAVADAEAREQPPYPLTLVAIAQRSLLLRLGYDARRFDEGTVDRMLGHLAALLGSMIADAERPVGDLSMLGAEERERVVVDHNRTATEYPRDATIHALFAEQAARTPDAVAVVLGDARLTYAELDRRANQLAHHLREKGVGHETPVGLYARRSLEMVIATLAISKAGGAYVPLDPELPEVRLAWLVADAGMRTVITAGVADAAFLAGTDVVRLDADAAAIAARSAEAPPAIGSAESLAYVMYTSGSTGAPKGVCVVHRGVVRLVKGADFARFGSDEVFLQLAPIAFDAATLEIWGPLLNGGTLAVFPPEPPSPARLGEVIRQHGVTTMWLTAGLFNAVIDQAPEALQPLRQLLAGGEALSVPHVQKARRVLPGVRLINGYGPTENTTFTCCHTITDTDGVTSIPIGRPIANTTVYVLDERRNPAPIGVPGELYTGGDGLARGYLNRPELTAERFVASPFDPEKRLYKTGDLVRWLPDGTIAFLGRLDFQVKLRGFRIELGEIEAVLGQHPGVAECAVIVREDAPGDRRLVAYVVPGAERPSAAELRAALKDRLPEYMVPSAVVQLDAMPLNANGKLDRRALPAPDAAAMRARDYVAPRSPVEQALVGILADVLRLPADQVGVTDSFFELGGHSLLATQAATRIRAVFGVELPLRALFEAPTAAELSARVEAALRAGQGPAAPPITRAPREGNLPLSFGQERLWFLSQLDPSSPAYVVPLALRLSGMLDTRALQRALAELVRRHEVLRTTFTSEGGKPVQVIHPPAEVPLPISSISHLSPADRERAIRTEAEADARRAFDLATGPVLRASLIQVAPDDSVLLLTLHHIVADQWTNGVISRELTALYEAFSQGLPSPLPEIEIQYADYAVWQRGWLSGEVLDQQIAYWKKQLDGAPQALELPTDRPRPPVQSFRGAARLFTLSPELLAAIKELGRREGATLYMTLLAAFDLLLHRYSGQDDIVVGTPIAGRTRAETEGLVGLFLNTLVMRAQLAPDMTFKELLAKVKETSLGAFAHQDMPFERLVQELNVEPDPSRSPLFQVIFNLQNAPKETLHLEGVRIKGAVAENATVKVDLTLMMMETPRGLTGRLEYSTDLFDAATVDRFVRQFETLLAAAAKEPQKRLRDLPVLPEDERRRLLVEWNDTAARYATAECFHELFEAQVDETPDAPAVVAGDARLTYRELDARANRLAHHLRARGVGPDSVVGLCLERTSDLVVAVLGVFKAGGAYVPLDATYPARRLVQILGDARATVVVTLAALADKVTVPGVTVVRLDADAAAIAAESDARPALEATPGDLAYVLFTSGSTGTPKGVAIEHRNLVNYVRGVSERLALPAGATYAYVSTFAADLGNTSLFPSLAGGGCLHVIAQELASDPDALGEYMAHEGIDVMKIVPSHLSALLSGASPEQVLPRKLLVLGGEASSWELIDRIERLAPDCRIMNHYGPTETTVGVLTYPIVRGARPDAPIVPLGRPLPNSRVYVLDAQMSPTPTGVPGELYIGGAGVARGYLNQPELTKDRFVKDPFSGSPGARLYKTGDRARFLPDGSILFLGRIDFQVKIRGFRIELGEIESALAAHAGIKDAVVLAEDDGTGNRRLIAYVVPRPAEGPNAAEMAAFLEQRLPEYMVPSAFVLLDALPLTPNGKIDRKALAAIEVQREGEAKIAPRNPIEDVLAGIWCDVFERESIGVHERFNDLGGHSLLAIQIIARARDAFDVQIPLRAIFEAPTISELSQRIDELRREGEQLVAPPIERAPRDRDLPLSFAQERLWLLDRLEPNKTAYNVPSAMRLSGPLDVEALTRALREVVRRHEVLRTTFTLKGAAPVQIIHEAIDLDLPLIDLSALPPEEREVRVRAASADDAETPFDLERGPLIRAKLLRLSPTAHVLLVSMHHIVSDAQTQGVLNDEIGTLYDAFAKGEPSPLPELPIQYADFAAWKRGWMTGAVLEKQLAYWRNALAGAPGVLDLPADRPRPPTQSFRGARHNFELPPELKKTLAELSRREGATLFMTMLAAWDVLLQRWSGQRDIVVGTPAMNRTRAETEGLIGCFLNTLVLRAHIDDTLTFQELLQRVREACLGAYAHQDMPFERLVQELSPERDLSRSPVFQVMFTLQAASSGEAGMTGVRRRRVAAPLTTAKFDLTLFIFETPRGLLGSFEYATDLFDAATIERMAAQLATLLAGIAAAPDKPLRELPILPAAERAKVTTAWNATATPYPHDATIATLVSAQAARTPDAIAVSSEGRELTYRALDARANRLARHLRARGVGPETLVGIAVERTEAMVVGLLGILKAGGAYVPLDPTYPRERLAFMAEDAKLGLLITEEKLAGVVPDPAGGVVRIDADWPVITQESADPIEAGVTPESLAYVIYTSGSTGRPKGVQLPHRAVVNFLVSMAKEPGLRATDRLLAVTSLSFDIAGLELWLPLTVGARVEIANRATAGDGGALARRIAEQQITVMQATPSTFRLLIDAGWKGDGKLKVLVGGEAVPRELVDQLVERAGSVWNMYGPTETTIWSCVQPLAKDAPVLIGKPIANTRVVVLDANGGLSPIGVPGELYIGGDGVARGYLNRPELTEERFVPDPFSDLPGARMYRTGDLVRWREGGALEFLGRLDFQVKIRGFRIELGEIEAVLGQLPGVRQAVVMARDFGAMDKRLVAYLVPADAAAPPALEDLRATLRSRLPDYMVPSSFVVMDAFPLTPAGKVDRRALPAPQDAGTIEAAGLVMPRDEEEVRIAAIWRDVLGLPRVGVTDSFFDLGGHSMLAVRMMDELEKAFGQKIPLVALFESRTVEALAKLVRRGDAGKTEWPAMVPIRPNGTRRPLFLVARPNVNTLGYIALVKQLDADQPVYGLQIQYPEETALGRPYTLEERRAWSTRYLELMKAVQPEGPYLVAGMCEGALIAFDMVRRLEDEGQKIAFFGVFDTWPEENTSVRWLHRVFIYERTLRVAWLQGPDELYRYLRSRAGRVVRTVLSRVRPKAPIKGPGLRPLRAEGSPWDVRMWPGPSFVPPRVKAHIDLFRTRKKDYWRIDDPEFGWGSRTAGGVDIHLIGGNHATFMREEHIQLLGRQLRSALDQASEEIQADAAAAARARAAATPERKPEEAPTRVDEGARAV
ncbi:MAG: amino acid adenylation domain-containing protein [Minicystis sp.]